jgi:hypothetical protein
MAQMLKSTKDFELLRGLNPGSTRLTSAAEVIRTELTPKSLTIQKTK